MMSALGQLGGRLYRGEVSFDFVGRKRLWYAISGLILLISIVAVIVRGLSFSVDFKGGAVFTFPSSSTTLSQVQNAVESGGRVPIWTKEAGSPGFPRSIEKPVSLKALSVQLRST